MTNCQSLIQFSVVNNISYEQNTIELFIFHLIFSKNVVCFFICWICEVNHPDKVYVIGVKDCIIWTDVQLLLNIAACYVFILDQQIYYTENTCITCDIHASSNYDCINWVSTHRNKITGRIRIVVIVSLIFSLIVVELILPPDWIIIAIHDFNNLRHKSVSFNSSFDLP